MGTALEGKLSGGTTGKLVGMVIISLHRDNQQPSPKGYNAYGCSSQTKWQWVRCIHLA